MPKDKNRKNSDIRKIVVIINFTMQITRTVSINVNINVLCIKDQSSSKI